MRSTLGFARDEARTLSCEDTPCGEAMPVCRERLEAPARTRGARLYALLVRIGVPLRWWVRLEVDGGDLLPPPGIAVLVVANHDSMLDPLVIADTMVRAGILVRFLAMSRLWTWPLVGPILNALGQIPVVRGEGGAAVVDSAARALRAGGGVCIFPEGGLSQGRTRRARGGVARIIAAAPEAVVLLAAVSGGTDLVRFPKRPIVRVQLFRPRQLPATRAGQAELAASLLAQIRVRVPPVAAGRRTCPDEPTRVREGEPV